MKTFGNLFELAEKQLIQETLTGKRRKYTMVDVINYAVKIRKWLDKNDLCLSNNEKTIRHREAQNRYTRKKK